MQRFATVLAALALSGCLPAWAQGKTDLMKTPECIAARKQLDEAVAAAGPRARLVAAREQAALKCFGTKPDAPPEGRFVAPPAPADPIRPRTDLTLPAQPGPAAPPAPPPPPVAIPRAPAVTSCDPAGCWDSNGTRYNQQGPMLLGPRGVCTLQAGVMNCP